MSNNSANGTSTKTNTVVGVVVKNSIHFVETVFQNFSEGNRVVLLNSADDQDRLSLTGATEIIDPEQKNGWSDIQFSNIYSDDIAQISFTSGTEGAPKGVLITHANLADVVDRLKIVMEPDSSIREYIGVPAYHSFGFGRCRFVANVGGQFFLPESGFNPIEIQEMLEKREINALSAVPSLIRVLFENKDLFGDETQHMRWIEIGSQYMSQDEKILIKSMFPNAVIVQHYGLTEGSRTTFLKIHNESSTWLESVGEAFGDTEIKIADDGCIMIRGSHVASELLVSGDVVANVDSDGWMLTNDQGTIEEGHLFYKGRTDDIINCGGVKISPDTVERAIRTKLDLHGGFACAKILDELRGESVLLARSKDCNATMEELVDCLNDTLKSMNVNLGSALKCIEVDSLPTTATGKVQRKKLTTLFAEKNTASIDASSQSTKVNTGLDEHQSESGAFEEQEQKIAAIWKDALKVEHVGIHESFSDLGGDSLTALSASIRMRKLGVAPEISKGLLQGKTIYELARAGETPDDSAAQTPEVALPHTQDNENIKFIRGLLVLAVIFGHWSGAIFERLPELFLNIQPFFAPVFSAGTPGFALIYGVAIGYTFYPQFLEHPKRLLRLLKSVFLFLLSGISILALIRVFSYWYVDGEISMNIVANSFHGVLTYYLLATASVYAWFKILSITGSPAASALAIGLFLHLTYLLWFHPLTLVPASGFLELGKLLIAAKYSYFSMTGGVMLGIALGIWLFGSRNELTSVRGSLLYIGILLVVSSVLLSHILGEEALWTTWPTRLVESWKWLFYLGVIMIFIRVVAIIPWTKSIVFGFLFNVIACIGFLAFPLFLGQEVAIPIKEILTQAGLPDSLAIVTVLGTFIATSAFLVDRCYRLNYK